MCTQWASRGANTWCVGVHLLYSSTFLWSSTSWSLLISIICCYFMKITVNYRIRRNIDSDFNLAVWQSRKDCQINLCHFQSIYTTIMGFTTYSTQNRQFKILPTAFLSKLPNIMFANNSAYTVYCNSYYCNTIQYGWRKYQYIAYRNRLQCLIVVLML